MNKILITGAAGQIGSELTVALRRRYGDSKVVACGHKTKPDAALLDSGPFVFLDIRDFSALASIVETQKIDTVFHLAGILSAVAEKNPQMAWDINMTGLKNVLEMARICGCAVFFPSSIGAFGPSTPPDNTPQLTIQRPRSIYGISKLTGELLCDYYFQKFGVDTRGLRFPGLISSETRPGGGTTDYAVEIFYAAVKQEKYCCFLEKGTTLDMMYMKDALRATITLMEADPASLTTRNAFNVTAMSFAPEDICAEIRKTIPNFTMSYEVDPLRQSIADSWPNKMDDSEATKQWGWQPEYDLPTMTREMISILTKRQQNDGGR